MKTQRAYYADSHTAQFSAVIIARTEVEGRPAVVLDHTYFYPTGGGQPHDTGTINDARVVDVQTRADDLAVLHILDRPVEGERADCQIDWARRFDHMQQHTGQHILSAAFIQVAGINTVGFHLSADTLTIDLDRLGIAPEVMAQAEALADEIVFRNLPVTAAIVDPAQTSDVRQRGTPEALATDGLRVVTIGTDDDPFDRTACGGTHVRATGEIGLIKIMRAEKRGDKTRVELRCGGRALGDYRLKNALAYELTAALNCGLDEIGEAVGRQSEQIRALTRQLKDARTRLLEFEAARLLSEAELRGEVRLVRFITADYGADDLRLLAKQLVAHPGCVVLCGASGEKAALLIARSADLTLDLKPALSAALATFGGRGGGTPDFAQGGGVSATEAQLAAACVAAESILFS
jgi:alanyl-tRNA synthetase